MILVALLCTLSKVSMSFFKWGSVHALIQAVLRRVLTNALYNFNMVISSLLTAVLLIKPNNLFDLLAVSAHYIVDLVHNSPRSFSCSDWFNTCPQNSYSTILFLLPMRMTEHLFTLNSIYHSCDHLYNLFRLTGL